MISFSEGNNFLQSSLTAMEGMTLQDLKLNYSLHFYAEYRRKKGLVTLWSRAKVFLCKVHKTYQAEDTSQVEECIQHFHLIFHEGNLDSSTYTHVTTICGSEVCKIHTEERSARVQLEKETQKRRITCRVDPSSRTDRNRTLECIAFPAVLWGGHIL